MQLAKMGNILGGKKTLGVALTSKMDLVTLGNIGITKQALKNLADQLSLSMKQIADLLPITERTLQRYTSDQHLNRNISEHILHIAEVIAKGTDVFGNRDKLIIWINTPHRVFSGQTPLSMLSSRFGTELVLEELGRIEFGVYS